MDTTEQYIKMRGKAIPELGMGTPPVKSPPCFITDNVWVDAVGNWYSISDEAIGCQLERQDQLQEMCGDCNNPYPIIKRFTDYALSGSRLDGNEWIMLSMEQLWLAFEMKEKYNKVWNGEEWVRDG